MCCVCVITGAENYRIEIMLTFFGTKADAAAAPPPPPPPLAWVLDYAPDVPAPPTWLVVVLVSVIAFDLLRRLAFYRSVSFAGKHVVVTGGSQGIGKALAEKLLARGARVTILARTESTLAQATADLRDAELARRSKLRGGSRAARPEEEAVAIQYVSASTTDFPKLSAAMERAAEAHGPIDCLIACAGGALPGLLLHTSVDDYQKAMDVNYMGTLKSVKAVVEGMVARRRGMVIIIGSALSVVGFMGYSTYASTKHALRGLADTLRNELIGFGISVHIAYPPDTQTPGFDHENETKPIETASMVPIDVFPAESVAESMLRGAEKGLYHLPSPDPVLNLMVASRAGVSPRAFPLAEALLMPLASVLESLASAYFDVWGRRYARRHEREVAEKAKAK